jgi:hypothetical protein
MREQDLANKSRHLATVIAFAIAIFASSLIQPIATAEMDTDSFSVIWITDTQYLSESNPKLYDNLCQWITQNNATYNVKMVIHTGDIVNDEGNRTQWQNANQSMSILLNNGIPYCWDAGNHDYNDTYWVGNQYTAFNPEALEAKPFWVSDDFGGMNTAVHFNASGQNWLIVNVAFQANNSVLEWANNILDANPQAHAIVAMHAYLDRVGEYEQWATSFKTKVLDTHANVFLTLSGHYYPTSGLRTRVGERDELLFNQQDAYDQMGAESARILTFNPAQGTIKVQTFSLYLNQLIEDADNSFTLQSSFRNGVVGSGFSTVFVAAVVVGVFCVAGLFVVVAGKRVRRKR